MLPNSANIQSHHHHCLQALQAPQGRSCCSSNRLPQNQVPPCAWGWRQFADEGAQRSHLVPMPWPQGHHNLLVLLLWAWHLPSLPQGMLKLHLHGAAHLIHIFTSMEGWAQYLNYLGVNQLFWLFYIIFWAHNAQCHIQPIHVFTPVLYQLME